MRIDIFEHPPTSAHGRNLPLNFAKILLIDRPLLGKADIESDRMSAYHSKAAVSGIWARMTANDPKQTIRYRSLGSTVKNTNKSVFASIATCLVAIAVVGLGNSVVAQEQPADKPATIEFYYKVKWGYFDEFYELFRRNHYPILKRLQESGRILEMSAAFPVHHQGESDRWDMRFTVVYTDPKYVYEYVYGPALVEELFPDQALFKKEEKRRFDLLLEHKDVPVRVDDLSDWNTD